MASGCGQWVWSMAVSIGGKFTGKLDHEISLFLLSVSFFAAAFLILPLFFNEIDSLFLFVCSGAGEL